MIQGRRYRYAGTAMAVPVLSGGIFLLAYILEERCGARLIELLYCRYEFDGAWTHTLLLRDTTLMQYT